MKGARPLDVLPWLVSRAAGILALVLISFTVVLGLAMAARTLRAPRARRLALGLHEHLAVTALGALAVHGVALLGDGWLRPGWRGILVPFALGYRPLFTGLGIIGGYLALLLGPSFYLRRRIGARRWRALHRATGAVWVLSAVHALGSGSDAGTVWLRAVVLAPVVPLAYLVVMRVLGRRVPRNAHEPARRPTPTTPLRAVS